MKRRGAQPTLITNAARSQEDQLRTREQRYVVLMIFRVLCLVLAAVVAATQPPLWWLWLALCAAGMAFLPWIAVVLANGPLPKEKHRLRRYQPGSRRGLPAAPADTHPVRTIDHQGS